MLKGFSEKRYRTLLFILVLIAVSIIIYLYFLKWKTDSIYGDDLYLFKDHASLNTFSEKIKIPLSAGKYRPVHGLGLHFLIECFQKNLNGYYLFNVGIQTINALLFGMVVNI